jgi:hypothetical protein
VIYVTVIIDPCDHVIAILEHMMAKSDDNRETIKVLTDAIRTETKAIHDTADAKMRVEPETEHQKKMDVWIADMKDGREGRTDCQEATEANPEKMEPNPGEKEAALERRKIPNEEAVFNF